MDSTTLMSTASQLGQRAMNVGRSVVAKATDLGRDAKHYLDEKLLARDEEEQIGGARRKIRSLKNLRVGDKVYVGKKTYMVGLRGAKKVLYPYSNQMELGLKLNILKHKGSASDKKKVAKALTALLMADYEI